MTEGIRFAHLDRDLRQRLARSHVSLLSPSSPPLRTWLLEHLEQAPEHGPGALVSEPVFEPKFGYREVSTRLADVGLHPKLLEAMDSAPESARFAGDWFPYTHQTASWRLLSQTPRQSVVVSSGTGSGKTECFMVPILDDLVRQSDTSALEGVQALFLYPLNALISSQRERLSAWTATSAGKVRFCLYNGNTPEGARTTEPQEVPCRRDLRKSPPPVLVTNATMLEYMLVRPVDAPILSKSQGRLKYIVLDEAHTYVGSAAAELALLLRRVLDAFGVTADDVSFIATSATISAEDPDLDPEERNLAEAAATRRVTDFLANLSGHAHDRVHVVRGHQDIPPVPDSACPTPQIATVRQAIQDRGPQRLGELQEAAGTTRAETLELLDRATRTTFEGQPLLPLRGHAFARPLEGIWACSNAECPHEDRPHDEWSWGAVYTTFRASCPHCDAQVHEVVLCRDCGVPYLLAESVSEVPERLKPVRSASSNDDDPDELDFDTLDPTASAADPTRLIGPARRQDALRAFKSSTGALDDGGPRVEVLPAPQDQGVLSCSHCGARAQGDRDMWRACRTGQSFVLGVTMPTLLDQLPADPDATSLTAYGGRRLITFTDSRQGTARFAARAQGQAERLFIRSWIYQTLLASKPQLSAKKRNDLQLDREERLCDIEARPARRVHYEQQIAAIDEQLAGKPEPLALDTLAKRLLGDPAFENLLARRRDYTPFERQHESSNPKQTFARNLILQEVVRRPTRASSLETLGLVTVGLAPDLGVQGPPPALVQLCSRAGVVPDETWNDILLLLVHFHLRANAIIDVDTASFRWMGTRIRPKSTLRPGEDREKGLIPWPSATAKGQPPRIVRLLARAFDLDPHRDLPTLNGILEAAYQELRGVMEQSTVGRRLATRHLTLAPLDTAWVCPITRQLLDVTLLGHTPYQPPLRKLRDSWDLAGWRARPDTTCREVILPRPPFVFGRRMSDDEPLPTEAIEAWLASEDVTQARAAGAWSEFSDRIVTPPRYFTIAEHSAQVPSRELRDLETRFKQLKLNVLSCSTTMEMGVDIGGLSAVAMNNVPPNPGNFKQRAGRAGRRGEQRAASVTVCRHLPHEQAVYHAPTWPFRTPIHVTRVSLDKERIVLRHVNAMALRHWLGTKHEEAALTKLQASWLFGSHDDTHPSRIQDLVDWCRAPETHARLKAPLSALVVGTACSHQDAERLLATLVDGIEDADRRWLQTRNAMAEQRQLALDDSEDEDSASVRATTRQLERFEGEFLLGVLAGLQVLPSYGFPTDVLPFVPDTAEELSAASWKRRSGGQLEDRRGRDTSPTRPLRTALQEYAPGAKVVLRGRTYTSAGVTLNWRVPADALRESSVRELQAFGWIWQCRTCGLRGLAELRPHRCPTCGGRQSKDFKAHPMLRPAGFTTDIGSRAEMDYTSPGDNGSVDTWVGSGTGDFASLGRPARMLYRHSARGQLLWTHRGRAGKGFAVCLRCGRAAAMKADGTVPKSMENHRRLRGRTTGHEDELICRGANENYGIKSHLLLGGDTHTDVLELRLLQADGTPSLVDVTCATTLAVALRRAGAELLGLDPRELGFDVRTAPEIEPGVAPGWTVLLYDQASGGAGYCEELAAHLQDLLDRAARTAHCPADCDSVCHACLLGHDTQHHVDHIDRELLTRLLDDVTLAGLALPEDVAALGDVLQEWQPPMDGLVREARRNGAKRIRLYVEGPVVPGAWHGRTLLTRLRDGGIAVELVVAEDALNAADTHAQRALEALAGVLNVDVRVGTAPVRGPYRVWAQLAGVRSVELFTDAGSLAMDEDWTRDAEAAWFVRTTDVAWNDLHPAELQTTLPPDMVAVTMRHIATGRSTGFGDRLIRDLDRQAGLSARIDGPATVVRYTDRYVRAPVNVLLLRSVLLGLRNAGWIDPSTAIEVVTERASRNERYSTPTELHHAWRLTEIHEEVSRLLLGRDLGPTAVHVRQRRDADSPGHMRLLTLDWGHQRLEVRLDRGLGFARTRRNVPFDFSASVTEQIDDLDHRAVDLIPIERHEAHGVVRWVTSGAT